MIPVKSFAMGGLSIIPVRRQHDDTSEMVTQLLFGEIVQIIASNEQWLKVRILHDNYEGWVDYKQLFPLSTEAKTQLQDADRLLQDEAKIHTPWGLQTIYRGSLIISKKTAFLIDKSPFHWTGDRPPQQNTQHLGELVNHYLNAPYLWGGRTKYGIDCSGLTQALFHQIGINLNRDASQQANQGETIALEAQKMGDLAFFSSLEGENISHVGLILPKQKIVHAHGRVRIDQISNEGIINKDTKKLSHRFIKLKRILQLKSIYL